MGKISRVVIQNDGSLRVVYKSGSEAETESGVEAYKETDSTARRAIDRSGRLAGETFRREREDRG
ncbi:MAG: hypothetical protein M0C28_29535 [Candidatus Moduliflexus flocculans]|nr:hypothetical protein [Candidatus Moduliflexus flocculans]